MAPDRSGRATVRLAIGPRPRLVPRELGVHLADSSYVHRDAEAWALPLRRAGAQLVQDLWGGWGGWPAPRLQLLPRRRRSWGSPAPRGRRAARAGPLGGVGGVACRDSKHCELC